MTNYDTTGRRLPLPRAWFEPPEPWKDADQKQLLQFLKTPSGEIENMAVDGEIETDSAKSE